MDVNSIVISGRLTRDAELKYGGDGVAIVRFGVAVNSRRKRGKEWVDEPSFFDCAWFGKLAETSAPKMTKGTPIVVSGSMRCREWGQPAQKHWGIVVDAASFQTVVGATNHPPRQVGVGEADDSFADDVPF